MKIHWQIKDLIDLEYYLGIEATHAKQNPSPDSGDRDRRIYLDHILPKLKHTMPLPRRIVIKSWLDRRRKMDKEANHPSSLTPGETFADTLHLIQWGLFIMGGLSGIGLAISLLTYSGTTPLNVSVYIGVTVLGQILLLVLLGGFFTIRMIRPKLFYTAPLYSILSRGFIALIGKIKKHVMGSLSAARRQGVAAAFGLVRGKKQVYGTLFYWPFFNAMQLFGIGFNLGLLGATLMRVAGTDMAFGWQSTIQVSADAVHAIVKWLAAPWSWLVSSDLAHPTLAQIEGSRLILKDGIYALATPDLVAWWPFLCFAVLMYGFLPRLVFFILGNVIQTNLIKKINFTHAACDQLVDRLTLPRVRFEPPKENRSTPSDAKVHPKTPNRETPTEVQKHYAILIPDDIFDACATAELDTIIRRQFGGLPAVKIRISQSDTDNPEGPQQLFANDMKNNPWSHILYIQEAWQPPIIEEMAFIKSIRHFLGEKAPITIGLIGKPKSDTIFTPVSPINRQTWQERLASLGDPYLRLEELRL